MRARKSRRAHKAGKLFAVIWTTTPWTLPANLGISLNETFDYVALKSGENYYIVAQKLAEEVIKATGHSASIREFRSRARTSRRSMGRISFAIRF